MRTRVARGAASAGQAASSARSSRISGRKERLQLLQSFVVWAAKRADVHSELLRDGLERQLFDPSEDQHLAVLVRELLHRAPELGNTRTSDGLRSHARCHRWNLRHAGPATCHVTPYEPAASDRPVDVLSQKVPVVLEENRAQEAHEHRGVAVAPGLDGVEPPKRDRPCPLNEILRVIESAQMATDAVVGLRKEERREVRDDPFERRPLALDRTANVKNGVVVRPVTSSSACVGTAGIVYRDERWSPAKMTTRS